MEKSADFLAKQRHLTDILGVIRAQMDEVQANAQSQRNALTGIESKFHAANDQAMQNRSVLPELGEQSVSSTTFNQLPETLIQESRSLPKEHWWYFEENQRSPTQKAMEDGL